MSPGALVLLDEEAAGWWASGQRDPRQDDPPADATQVFCGSLRSWAVLEREGATRGVRWLGGLGERAWEVTARQLDDWHAQLAAIPAIPADAPVQDPLTELLVGDQATPALLSLALLPVWAEQLAAYGTVHLPVGSCFRPPRFSRLGDLPLLVLAAVLRQRGQAVALPTVLPRPAAGAPEGGRLRWSGPEPTGAAWLTIGKLRHPDIPLVALEAAGLPVVLFESQAAPPLPELFSSTPRCRCLPFLAEAPPGGSPLPACPEDGATAAAAAWLERLRHWPPLALQGQAVGRERCRLDRWLERLLTRSAPALALVPEENDPGVDRLLARMRRCGRPHAVLHHTAEVLPAGVPLRWQRHLRPEDPRVVPLRGQRMDRDAPAAAAAAAVLSLDPVRAHLLDALELEGPLPQPQEAAVGWLHYPLLQQALVPLADPRAYWEAVNQVHGALAALGVPLLLARKPPLEPRRLSDARAQGLTVPIHCLPLAELLARSRVVIAPGHIGTGHLEAVARGRVLVLVRPERLRRPSLLLGSTPLPLPALSAGAFARWWTEQDEASLSRLARRQEEWLRRQLLGTSSLVGWLAQLGVDVESRPQRFLGSGLMAQRPLLERVEAMGRTARRIQALRGRLPVRLLLALRRGARR